MAFPTFPEPLGVDVKAAIARTSLETHPGAAVWVGDGGQVFVVPASIPATTGPEGALFRAIVAALDDALS